MGRVQSITYSPDRQHIISGSDNRTIQIWDVETGVAIGKPLKGHTDLVQSIAYSPNRQCIISGSNDYTIRIWNAETGAATSKSLEGHTSLVNSVAFSPDGGYIISGSNDNTSLPSGSIQTPSSNPMHADFCAKPDLDGWVRDSEGGLLYWVLLDCHTGLHSPAHLTIPLTPHVQSISLDFHNFAFGTSWTQIFNSAPS